MPSALDLGRHSLFVNTDSLFPSTYCEFSAAFEDLQIRIKVFGKYE